MAIRATPQVAPVVGSGIPFREPKTATMWNAVRRTASLSRPRVADSPHERGDRIGGAAAD